MKKNKKFTYAIFVLLSILSGVYLFPWLYMLLRSFLKYEPGVKSADSTLLTLEHYRLVLKEGGFLTCFFNSLIVLICVVAANIIFSAAVGYAFARYKFKFKGLLFFTVVASLTIPKQTLMIPWLGLMVNLGLYDTLLALILPFCADGFNIFLMKQYIAELPIELEEAARADGASETAVLWHVILPLCKPAIAILVVNTSIITWNSFLFPLIFTNSASCRTLPVALAMLSQNQYATDWGTLMAGASVSSVPIIIVFWLFQKQIISGMVSGALKE